MSATQEAAPAAAPQQMREGREQARGGRPRPRFQGKGGDKGHHSSGGGRGRSEPRQDSAPPREAQSRIQRDRPIDPNSPFAKLAALKEQLELNAKEKR